MHEYAILPEQQIVRMLTVVKPRTQTILMVDDEDAIQDLVTAALRFAGYRAEPAASGQAALQAAATLSPDLLVLDVNLPDLDGFEVCRRLRASGSQAAVIFLTARDAPADVRSGFTGGGDDYLTKPFRLEELLLRIEAVLRRAGGQQEEPAQLVCGDIVVDLDACRVWRGDAEIALTPTELKLLRYLLVNRDRVVSKLQILDHVWDYDFEGEVSAVETYVSYLRRKLNDREARLIRTVRGFGYSLRTPDAAAGPS
jgi:two-component system OmpR family response regulator